MSDLRVIQDIKDVRVYEQMLHGVGRQIYNIQRRPGPEFPDIPAAAAEIAALVLGSCIADYIVDSNGEGTHTSLFGAGGALTAAIATGLSRTIFICSAHVESIAATYTLTPFAANQRIVVFSLGRTRPVFAMAAGLGTSPMLTHSTTGSGGGSLLRFQGLGFSRTLGVGVGSWFRTPATGGPQIPEMELIDALFDGDSLAWEWLFDFRTAGSCNPQSFLLERVWGAVAIRAIFRISTAMGTGNVSEMRMLTCRWKSLRNIQERVDSTDLDIGRHGILIATNVFEEFTNTAWSKTYAGGTFAQNGGLYAFIFANNIIFDAAGAVPMLQIGTVGTTSPKDAAITGNTIRCGAAGANFVRIFGGAGTAYNIAVTGNTIVGPGSGTAIAIDIATDPAHPVKIDNAYRNWGTKVGGVGAPGSVGDARVSGFTAAQAASLQVV